MQIRYNLNKKVYLRLNVRIKKQIIEKIEQKAVFQEEKVYKTAKKI